jgi:hypothetical protein
MKRVKIEVGQIWKGTYATHRVTRVDLKKGMSYSIQVFDGKDDPNGESSWGFAHIDKDSMATLNEADWKVIDSIAPVELKPIETKKTITVKDIPIAVGQVWKSIGTDGSNAFKITRIDKGQSFCNPIYGGVENFGEMTFMSVKPDGFTTTYFDWELVEVEDAKPKPELKNQIKIGQIWKCKNEDRQYVVTDFDDVNHMSYGYRYVGGKNIGRFAFFNVDDDHCAKSDTIDYWELVPELVFRKPEITKFEVGQIWHSKSDKECKQLHRITRLDSNGCPYDVSLSNESRGELRLTFDKFEKFKDSWEMVDPIATDSIKKDSPAIKFEVGQLWHAKLNDEIHRITKVVNGVPWDVIVRNGKDVSRECVLTLSKFDDFSTRWELVKDIPTVPTEFEVGQLWQAPDSSGLIYRIYKLVGGRPYSVQVIDGKDVAGTELTLTTASFKVFSNSWKLIKELPVAATIDYPRKDSTATKFEVGQLWRGEHSKQLHRITKIDSRGIPYDRHIVDGVETGNERVLTLESFKDFTWEFVKEMPTETKARIRNQIKPGQIWKHKNNNTSTFKITKLSGDWAYSIENYLGALKLEGTFTGVDSNGIARSLFEDEWVLVADAPEVKVEPIKSDRIKNQIKVGQVWKYKHNLTEVFTITKVDNVWSYSSSGNKFTEVHNNGMARSNFEDEWELVSDDPTTYVKPQIKVGTTLIEKGGKTKYSITRLDGGWAHGYTVKDGVRQGFEMAVIGIDSNGFNTQQDLDKNWNIISPQDKEPMDEKPVKTVDAHGDSRWQLSNGTYHREDGPAYETKDGYKQWIINGKLHREDGPAVEDANGNKSYYLDGNVYLTVGAWESELKARGPKPTMKINGAGTKEWLLAGQLHREDGPAVEKSNGEKHWYKNNKRHRADGPAIEWANGPKEWWFDDKRHREDGPAYSTPAGQKEWFVKGLRHRLDGPAMEYADGGKLWYINNINVTESVFNDNEQVKAYKKANQPAAPVPVMTTNSSGDKVWKLNGKLHREDGPAVEYNHGHNVWYLNDRKHRVDGPASITAAGDKEWFFEGKYHRAGNLPAAEYAGGDKYWFVNGVRHRTDGAAIEYANGDRGYYLDGNSMSEADFKKKMNMLPDTTPVMTTTSYGDKVWKLNGVFHREDGPAIESKNGDKTWYKNGKIHREDGPAVERINGERQWLIDGKHHRVGGAALIYASGESYWYQNGVLHREDGPAYIIGETKQWYINGVLSRTDGPAIEYSNGDKCWYKNGKPHKEDGPAYLSKSGKNQWYLDGIAMTEANFNKKMLGNPIEYEREKNTPVMTTSPAGTKKWTVNGVTHRADGPALEYANGDKIWYFNGSRHRDDGPAIEYVNGEKKWYFHGKSMTEAKFLETIKLQQKDNKVAIEFKTGMVISNGDATYEIVNVRKRTDGVKNGFENEIRGVLRKPGHALDGKELTFGYMTDKGEVDGGLSTSWKVTKEAPTETFMERVKDDMNDASWRIASAQFTAAIKGGILMLFKDKGFDDTKMSTVKEILESEFGTAMVAAALGYGLTYIPGLKDDPRVVKIAKEFRISSMATVGNEVLGVGIQYVMPALNQAIKMLPPVEVKPVVKKRIKKEKASVDLSQVEQQLEAEVKHLTA